MVTSIVSVLTACRSGATRDAGEITLRGACFRSAASREAAGGAAGRHQDRPDSKARNEKDLAEIPDNVKKGLTKNSREATPMKC